MFNFEDILGNVYSTEELMTQIMSIKTLLIAKGITTIEELNMCFEATKEVIKNKEDTNGVVNNVCQS